ncbi:MAG: hypothetical protein HY713_12140 [candidate division NC10 bacterium]|nr:hypothetical protein [candidate division NC10 bacterium]
MPYGFRISARAFGLAVPVHFSWEMSQANAFTGMPREVWAATAACAFASLGDGLLTLLILAGGAAAFRSWTWFDARLPGRWALVGILSFGVAVVTEWVLVYELHRWGYATSMPLIPGLRVGLLPVLQMVLLSPLVLRWASLPPGEWCHQS